MFDIEWTLYDRVVGKHPSDFRLPRHDFHFLQFGSQVKAIDGLEWLVFPLRPQLFDINWAKPWIFIAQTCFAIAAMLGRGHVDRRRVVGRQVGDDLLNDAPFHNFQPA